MVTNGLLGGDAKLGLVVSSQTRFRNTSNVDYKVGFEPGHRLYFQPACEPFHITSLMLSIWHCTIHRYESAEKACSNK